MTLKTLSSCTLVVVRRDTSRCESLDMTDDECDRTWATLLDEGDRHADFHDDRHDDCDDDEVFAHALFSTATLSLTTPLDDDDKDDDDDDDVTFTAPLDDDDSDDGDDDDVCSTESDDAVSDKDDDDDDSSDD